MTQKNSDRVDLSKNLSLIKKDKTNLTNKILSISELSDVAAISNKLKELELKESVLNEQLEKLDREILQLKSQKINQTELRAVFNDFVKIYDSLPIETKRLLNKLIFAEIVSFNERGKDSGRIEMSIRADGRLTSKWPKTINPEELSKQLRGHWLREQDSNLHPELVRDNSRMLHFCFPR